MPIDSIIPSYQVVPIWKKIILLILFAIIPLIMGLLLSFIIMIFMGMKTSCQYELAHGFDNSFIVEYGDLKKIMFPSNPPKDRYTVIIPVHNQLNRIFDDWGTQGKSVHGKWILEIKNNSNKYSKTLGEIAIEAKYYLKMRYKERYGESAYTNYKIGDGIWIKGETIGLKNIDYYFIATNMLSEKDVSCYLGDSKEKIYLSAIQSIVEAYCGDLFRPIIYMPIIGGGFAGIEKTQGELLKAIYDIFRFNGTRITSDIHVVIRKNKKHRPSASIYIGENV